MFKIIQSEIPGCFQIELRQIKDLRGSFTKTFHEPLFKELNIPVGFSEEFFIYSHQNVFRGMHFQKPPTAVAKIVYCVAGNVTDYVVDLRVGSPTYGQHVTFRLDSEMPTCLFMDKGLAHGYLVKSDFAIMQYKSSGVFDPNTDDAISYKSFPFASEITNPILSDRDINAVYFKDYNNEFKY